ncbi:hypothetical protein RCDURKIN_102 [Rhodobacter phage RcDurkin]|nr:hypothetical protein RCDURKIN_102 [Rhodobacter phage RcDurkin]UUV44472.1 hypothetical protein RCMENCHIE_103 [Rhodobacter phage RcMenchie]
MLRWRVKNSETGQYISRAATGANRVIGDTGGEWLTSDKRQASVYDDNCKQASDLLAPFVWELCPQRFADALMVQSAVNPAGVARSMHEAMAEIIREGKPTDAIGEDPAIKLFMVALASIMGMDSPVPFTEYSRACAACEAAAKDA